MTGRGNDFDDVVADITKMFKNKGYRGKNGGNGQSPPETPDLKGILPIILVALAVYIGYHSFYTVQQQEEAVVTRFGAYLSSNGPGLHFKVPIVDRVYHVSKSVLEQEFGYRKNTSRRAKGGQLRNESQMLTGDLNLADVEWMVQYRVADPKAYLFNVKDVERTIRDVSMSAMRRIVGDQLVGEVLTTGRAQIASRVASLMQKTLDEYQTGLKITTVELQSVDPPDEVKAAFNDVTAAKQEQEQDINKAEREYNRVIPEARGQAEKKLAEAEGFAIKVVNEAKGEVEYFIKLYESYSKAPEITRTRLYIETMEQVFSNTDSFTVVDEKIEGLLPVFNPGTPVSIKSKE